MFFVLGELEFNEALIAKRIIKNVPCGVFLGKLHIAFICYEELHSQFGEWQLVVTVIGGEITASRCEAFTPPFPSFFLGDHLLAIFSVCRRRGQAFVFLSSRGLAFVSRCYGVFSRFLSFGFLTGRFLSSRIGDYRLLGVALGWAGLLWATLSCSGMLWFALRLFSCSL